MPQQVINIGGSANDGTGDPLRTSFTKCNQNFAELYAKSAAGSNLDISDNKIEAINSNGNVQLVPNAAGRVIVVDDSVTISTSKTPSTATGAAGDKAGMIAWNATHIFVCVADYDGVNPIWKRAAIATW